jgi:hypothetical protein
VCIIPTVADLERLVVKGDLVFARPALGIGHRGLPSLRGKVMGSLPDGLTSPNSTEAMALPLSCPGYQASITPATLSSHGMSTGPPVLSTTIVAGLAFATASISRAWSPGKLSVD